MNGPLSGYRIVDLSTMVSGPMATAILADQGADVIKVERPGAGDLSRHMGPSRGGVAALFAVINRNKRSIALDLKAREGRALLERLVRNADAFVQNFRPGAVERLGIDEAALRQVRRDLVYVSISGFGEAGPYANKRVYDPVVQALSGLASIQRDRQTGRPRMVRTIIPDKVTALTAAQAITAALLARARTGEGQHVRLAMLDATVALIWPEGLATQTLVGSGVSGERGLAKDLVFETSNGYITVGAVSDTEWLGLTRAVDRPEWQEDQRFKTAASRVEHAQERIQQLAELLRSKPTDYWLDRFDSEEVPCAPVLDESDVVDHPQVVANRLVVESDHPSAGRLRQPRPAARFEKTPASIRLPAPALGQHSDEVLAELGVGKEEARDLRNRGIVS